MNLDSLTPQTLEALQYIAMGVAGGTLQSLGEDALHASKTLLASLRARWSGDEAALSLLTTAQNSPAALSAEQQDRLMSLLAQTLEEDEQLRSQAESLVASVPQLRVVQNIVQGQDVVGVEAQEFASGQVEVQQNLQKAEGVTGAKIGSIV